MPNVEKITIALTPELSALVKQSVKDGGYASTSEVIRDALRHWKHQQDLKKNEVEEVRKLWNEGINSGPGRYNSMEDLIHEAQSSYKATQDKD